MAHTSSRKQLTQCHKPRGWCPTINPICFALLFTSLCSNSAIFCKASTTASRTTPISTWS
eukprot:5345493-Amphidinium_carterae.2